MFTDCVDSMNNVSKCIYCIYSININISFNYCVIGKLIPFNYHYANRFISYVEI